VPDPRLQICLACQLEEYYLLVATCRF
jgi:hypothetical protein